MDPRRAAARRAGANLGTGLLGAVFLAGAASAGPLTAASFRLEVGPFPPAVFTGAGTTGAATSQLSASLDAGNGFSGAFTTTIPTSAAPPISAVQVIVTSNAGGTFAGATAGQVGGDLGVGATFRAYDFGKFPSGGAPLVLVPLQVGSPGTVFKSGSGVSVTAISAGWTVGTATVPATALGGPTTAMGSNALTPGGGGTLVLVTPVRILTGVLLGWSGFGVMSLTYVPEPGTLLLLGLGVASLAAVGARRPRA